ncbi:hypothetical protein D9615_010153 [Tricholomella constricta]|uniref:Gpr1 family protein n=1 Tax=Tricholomella constricta TaxID=117010 RepID=A0A8H5GRK8_9AGAR|nr:hypothetical protein D9615_010153 [Tricholomella constricta]
MNKNSHEQDPEKGMRSDDGENGAHSVAHTRRPSRIANPAPAGLFSFASTTFLLSMYNVNTRGIHTPNVVIGMAIFCGGLVQLLAGMWEFPRGNVHGATAFASYGAFWMSYATILIPGSGTLNAYANNQAEFHNALGMYLIVWFMVSTMLVYVSAPPLFSVRASAFNDQNIPLYSIPVVRRNLALTLLLGCLGLTYLLLGIGEFNGKASVTKAGGAFGIITALIAYYIGVSEMLAVEESAIVKLPLGIWSR